jgi:hypothetical protein
MRRGPPVALRLAISLAVVGCVWLFVREIRWDRVGHVLRYARIWPLVVAVVLFFAMPWGRAACWRIMLAPRYDVPTSRLFRYTVVGYAASVIAPARAGEVLRVWLLRRRERVPIADGVAVAVAEKLADAVSMLILVAPLPWLLPGLASWVSDSILVCAGIALGSFGVLYLAVGRMKTRDPTSWFGRVIVGMHVLHSGKRLLASFVVLVAVWIVDVILVMLVLYAVRIELPIAAALLILFVMNLAIMAPSTPGSVGAWEVGILAATRLLGVPDEPALAFALIHHLAQLVPLIVAGLAFESRLVVGRERVPVS